jgi:hypothetical protein
MHRTLKQETAAPPAKTARGQQGRFDRWRKQFNGERPHEALAMATPASLYAPSAKRFSEELDRAQYPFDVERALVDKSGRIQWQKRRVFVAQTLRDQLVELRPIRRRRRWIVSFGPVVLGHYDERSNTGE